MAEARLKAVPLLLCAVFPPLPLKNTQRSRLTRPEWRKIVKPNAKSFL